MTANSQFLSSSVESHLLTAAGPDLGLHWETPLVCCLVAGTGCCFCPPCSNPLPKKSELLDSGRLLKGSGAQQTPSLHSASSFSFTSHGHTRVEKCPSSPSVLCQARVRTGAAWRTPAASGSAHGLLSCSPETGRNSSQPPHCQPRE